MQKSIRFNVFAGAGVALILFAVFDVARVQTIIAANPPCNDCDSQTDKAKTDSSASDSRLFGFPCSCPVFVIDDRNTPNNAGDDYWYCDRFETVCTEDPGADVIQGDYSDGPYGCDHCPVSLRGPRFPGFSGNQSPDYLFRLTPVLGPRTTVGPVKLIQFYAEKTPGTKVRVYAAVRRYTVNLSGIPNALVRDVYLGVEVAKDPMRSYVDVGEAKPSFKRAADEGCWSFEVPGPFPILVLTRNDSLKP